MPDGRLADGLRLALTTLTVAPLRPGRVDRPAVAVAMGLAPLVGAALGAVLGAALVGLDTLSAPPLLAGTAVVGLSALLTRALHLDGLADAADALGSYRSAERALEIMKRADIGPFGVMALVLVLLAQVVSIVELTVVGVVVAVTTGRVAIAWACRRGVPAARPDGLGALVAGTLPWPVPATAALVTAAISVVAVPGQPWHGPLAVVIALGAGAALVRHATRRFGGVTGDVLGAACEVTTTACLAALATGS